MKITEQQIEEHVIENLRSIVGVESVRFVGQQVTLPSGKRLDVLAALRLRDGGFRWLVLEIKAVTARHDALVQLLEYMEEVSGIAKRGGRVPDVWGLLVAPEFSADAARAIRAISNVMYTEVYCAIEVFPVEERHGRVHHTRASDADLLHEEWVDRVETREGVESRRSRRKRRAVALAPASLTPHQWRGLALQNGSRA